jgi:hypothetical protein
MLVTDEPRARQYLERIGYYRDPYLVDVKGRFYPAEIPALSGFAEIEDRELTAPAAWRILEHEAAGGREGSSVSQGKTLYALRGHG